MTSEAWKFIGLAVSCGLALAVVLSFAARRLASALSNVRARPLGTVLCLLMLGFAVAYGGSKPSPSDPTGPDTPESPTPPTDPTDPPGDPPTPSDPSGTDDPTTPSDPSTPGDQPTDPSDPSGTDDPSTPSDPSDTDDPTTPSDPSTPSDDPTQPSDQTDPDSPAVEETYILYESISGAAPETASEYNGYLFDANGSMKGTIQVKVGKPNKNTGLASVKASVVTGAGKTSLKAAEKGKAAVNPDGPTEIALVGGETCTITIGADGLFGTYGSYFIDGARNFFSSKDSGEASAANAILGKWLAPINVVWDGGSVGVSMAKKGKVKVKGTAGSSKVSANAMFLVGEEWCAVPVVAPKANLSFVLWLSRDGLKAAVKGLGNSVLVGKAGSLASGAKFHISTTAALWAALPGTVLTDYLPDGIAVVQSGGKWEFPKAGKLSMKNGVLDVSKAGDNPSGLKLTCKAKDGSFKGSFKAYSADGGKLKATKVDVTGVMVDGVGYGTATVKKVGAQPVTIGPGE